ncbi:uncharacterized protein BKA78DRAFT_307539 [Phyllosticta capitalensis]|uniref:uncharacterized protein n=1 Tax=Phyllosticta capitalensis TaxID=121624 RepID=UPI00313217A6
MPRTRGQRPISTPAVASASNRLSTISTRSQSCIQRFGRIGKSAPEESPSKKRKAFVHNEGDEEEEEGESTIVEAVEDVDETPRLKRSRKRLLLNRPLPQAPTEDDTPTRGTSGLLSALDLSQTPPMQPRFSPSKETMRTAETIKTVDTPNSPTDTPATSPCCSEFPSSRPSTQDRKSDELPHGLLDLIDLHSSFLGALSFHYAHNGISSPVDIRMLIPAITTKWGKRKVTVEDIRRSLGVMQSSAFTAHPHPALKARTFILSDYGNGRICLEQQESRKARSRRSSAVIPPSIDENALNALFSIELSQRWDEYRRKITPNSKSPQSVSYFISQMPLTDINTSSLAKMGPLLAKGQQRLEDFKAGALKRQASMLNFSRPLAPQPPVPFEKETTPESQQSEEFQEAPESQESHEQSETDEVEEKDEPKTPRPATSGAVPETPAAQTTASKHSRLFRSKSISNLSAKASAVTKKSTLMTKKSLSSLSSLAKASDTTSVPPPVPALPKTKSLPSTETQTPGPNRSHHVRGASLLERIRAKQNAAANAPAGPTPEERARIAALHRAEEVLATLSLMASTASVVTGSYYSAAALAVSAGLPSPSPSTPSSPSVSTTTRDSAAISSSSTRASTAASSLGSGAPLLGNGSSPQRVSFPLPRLVRDVQASSRSPVGADEVRRCVEVLAKEVAVGYVALVKLGATDVVVVDLAKRVGTAEVRRRVGVALGGKI